MKLLGGGEGHYLVSQQDVVTNKPKNVSTILSYFSSDIYENLDCVRSDRYLQIYFIVLNQKCV